MHSVPAWEHPVGASAPCPLPPSPPPPGSVAPGQGDLVTLRLDSMLPAEFAPLLIRELLPPRDLYGVAVHAVGYESLALEVALLHVALEPTLFGLRANVM